jgi:CTP synthase (UTP-ammonia lyase)
MGIADADSAEHDTDSKTFIIHPVSCPAPNRREGGPKLSGACRLRIDAGSRLSDSYRGLEAEEEYFCSYEVNRKYLPDFVAAGLRLTAFDDNGELRAIELPGDRFFIATLYQPQLSSAENRPHPLIVAYLNASAGSRVYS